jgi:hypothetical protein
MNPFLLALWRVLKMKVSARTGTGIALILVGLTVPAAAHDAKHKEKPHGVGEVSKDIADHTAMAEAHLNAATCLEAGKSEKVCHAQLAKDCKGLAIGKYCGMKHKH